MNNKNNNVVKTTLRTATQAMAILAVFLVTFISCGKGDNEGNASNKDLIGTWVLESTTIDGIPEVDKPSEGYIDKPLENCGIKDFYVFTANQVTRAYIIKHYGTDKVLYKCEIKYIKGSYSISGNTISIIGEDGDGASATFSISGNKLTFTSTRKDETGKSHIGIATFVKQ